MTNVHRSPLSDADMNALTAAAAKANAHGNAGNYTPLYVAVDVGDASQRDGWLFVCWPALNSRSTHCARLIFDFIGDLVQTEFGAIMVATETPGVPDVASR